MAVSGQVLLNTVAALIDAALKVQNIPGNINLSDRSVEYFSLGSHFPLDLIQGSFKQQSFTPATIKCLTTELQCSNLFISKSLHIDFHKGHH